MELGREHCAIAGAPCVGFQPKAKGYSVDAFHRMKELVGSLDEDIAKAEGGNKAAGTRVRQAMQEIKAMAQEVRKEILDLRTKQSS